MKVTQDFFGQFMLHFITFFNYLNFLNYFLHPLQVLNITKVKVMDPELRRALHLLLNGDNICAMLALKSVTCLISHTCFFRKLSWRLFFLSVLSVYQAFRVLFPSWLIVNLLFPWKHNCQSKKKMKKINLYSGVDTTKKIVVCLHALFWGLPQFDI